MSEIITESTNENVKRGRNIKLKHNITKQKFIDGEHEFIVFNSKDLMFLSLTKQEYLITEISKTIKKFVGNAKNVLVVGLGNRHISADSLGAETLKGVIATRNLIEAQVSVSAISTSVFGLTGIESADIISSICKVVNPEVVILIDTLCAKSYESVGTNFQISNYGFDPGAGVGNFRKKINKNTINTKVITIGVPFVVYAKSFIENAIDIVCKKSPNCEHIKVFNEMLKLKFNNLVLTVKDINLLVKKCGYIISSAINMALNNYSLNEQKIILGK